MGYFGRNLQRMSAQTVPEMHFKVSLIQFILSKIKTLLFTLTLTARQSLPVPCTLPGNEKLLLPKHNWASL